MVGSDASPKSGISTVSMTITIIDINDGDPIILNPRTTPVSISKVRKTCSCTVSAMAL